MRKGMTMIEMLGVMAVLVILLGIAGGTVVRNNRRAQDTKALTALDAYRTALTSACAVNPGMVSDRTTAWGDDGTGYKTQAAFNKVVRRLNDYLDDNLQLVWDDVDKCYKSRGEDPWGGNYVLIEYPEDTTNGVSYYDCGATGAGLGRLCLSVWSTGRSDDVMVGKVVTEDCMGVALMYYQGLVDAVWQGAYDSTSLTGYTLRFQD